MQRILGVIALVAAFAVSPAAQSRPVHHIDEDGVKAPVLKSEVKPLYTQSARDRKVQGKIELKAVVRADGTVGDDVRIVESLDADLDAEAIKAVKQWHFDAGTKDGAAVDVEVDIELTFKLK